MEYIAQTIFLFAVLFVYLLSGSVVYSFVGEGYKATPLRCFAVGVGLWVLLVVLSTVFMPVNLLTLWWVYVGLTAFFLFTLPKTDQKETLSWAFFGQVAASFAIILPVFYFLENDQMHLWQEFAIYAKATYSIAQAQAINADLLALPLAYQLAIVPVAFLTKIQDSIFACFNFAILAFVACEFVRNSGVKIVKNNIAFPLVVAFTLLFFLNPFAEHYLAMSADPFIFIAAIGFAFSEYIFRTGHLPKNIAALPPAIILALLVFSSTQGLLLGFSLFVTLTIRYLMQAGRLNHKQALGYFLMPMLAVLFALIWQHYLATRGLGYLIFDVEKLNQESLILVYNAITILFKKHVLEAGILGVILLLGLYSFKNFKTSDDLIVDKLLLKPVFWISIVYLFVCLPMFFAQYDYIARASYSLGFTSVALLQFIILMPIGRILKEKLDHLDIHIGGMFKLTIIVALVVLMFMNRNIFMQKQNYRIYNIEQISQVIEDSLPKGSKVAVVDMKKTSKFYTSVLDYKNHTIDYIAINVDDLPKGIKATYKEFQHYNVDYVLLHAPNNLLVKNFEHNLDPKFTYLYKIEKEGFVLVKKFDNKLYKDTNIIIK